MRKAYIDSELDVAIGTSDLLLPGNRDSEEKSTHIVKRDEDEVSFYLFSRSSPNYKNFLSLSYSDLGVVLISQVPETTSCGRGIEAESAKRKGPEKETICSYEILG